MSIISKDGLKLIQEDNHIFCDSREIAKEFGKGHPEVLRDIRREMKRFEKANLLSQSDQYFIESDYGKSKKRYKRYKLTFDGFQMIVLQYSGDKAFLNRLKFLKLFKYLLHNIEKDKLQALANSKDSEWLDFRADGKEVHTVLTDIIKKTVVDYRIDVEGKMNDGRYYQHYANLINSKLGIETPKGTNVRDVVDKKTLIKIEILEEQIADMVTKKTSEGIYYKEVYQKIKEELAWLR